MKNTKQRTRALAECAVLVTLGTVLSMVKIPFPFGGSITFMSMLPLVILCVRHGQKWAFASSAIYSLLQMLTGVSTVSAMFMPGDSQMIWYKALLVCLIDYVFAYTVIGIACVFKNGSLSRRLALGAVTGLSLRYLMHIISGSLFYGAWAEWFFSEGWAEDAGKLAETASRAGAWFIETFTDPVSLSIAYSTVYNGLFMIPEIILTVIGALIVGRLPVLSQKNEEMPA